MSVFACARCGATEPRLERPPFGGAFGAEIAEQVCANCWAEWRQAEVMVINELRLNFMDPEAQATLTTHMREFLALGPESGS
jgi:Fe-S cluster biosynthesis and repair protein YggX